MANELRTGFCCKNVAALLIYCLESLLKLCSLNLFEFECLYFNLGAAAMVQEGVQQLNSVRMI